VTTTIEEGVHFIKMIFFRMFEIHTVLARHHPAKIRWFYCTQYFDLFEFPDVFSFKILFAVQTPSEVRNTWGL
jgi:hypothetical protein